MLALVFEWVDAIKNNYQPLSNFNYGADLTEMALLGVLSQRFGRKIKYNSEKMKITNDMEINELLKENMRDGWSFNNI